MSHGIYAHIKYFMHINKTCRKYLNQILQEYVSISQCSTYCQGEKSSILRKLPTKSAKTSIARAFNYVLVLKCPPLVPLLVCKFQALFQKPLKEKYGAFCIYNA